MKHSYLFSSLFAIILMASCTSQDINLEPIPVIEAQETDKLISESTNQYFKNGESNRSITIENNQIILTTDGRKSGKRISFDQVCAVAGEAGPAGSEHYLVVHHRALDSMLIAQHYFTDNGLQSYTSGKRASLFEEQVESCPSKTQAQIITTADVAHFFWTTENSLQYGQFHYRDSSGIDPLTLSGPTDRVSQFSATSLDGRLGLTWLQENDKTKELIFQERAEPGYHMRTLVLDSYEKTSSIQNIGISAADSTFTVLSQGVDGTFSYSVIKK